MNKENILLVIIIVSFILILLNFIFASNEMGILFWLRIIGNALLIFAMFLTLQINTKEKESLFYGIIE